MKRKNVFIVLMCMIALSIAFFAFVVGGAALLRPMGDPINDPRPCLVGDPIDSPKPNLVGDSINDPRPRLCMADPIDSPRPG